MNHSAFAFVVERHFTNKRRHHTTTRRFFMDFPFRSNQSELIFAAPTPFWVSLVSADENAMTKFCDEHPIFWWFSLQRKLTLANEFPTRSHRNRDHHRYTNISEKWYVFTVAVTKGLCPIHNTAQSTCPLLPRPIWIILFVTICHWQCEWAANSECNSHSSPPHARWVNWWINRMPRKRHI